MGKGRKLKKRSFWLFLLITVLGFWTGGMLAPGSSLGAGPDQTLVIAQGGEATLFDVIRIVDIPTLFISKNIYDYLVTIDFDGSYLPQLATSWKTSNDLKTWTFQLRKGVKFHDGTPFNSASVKFAFERGKDKNVSVVSARFAVINQIETPDDYTVVFKLNDPKVSFIDEIVNEYVGCIPSPAAVQKYGDKEFGMHPVGTGPFKFKEWVRNEKVVLERNEEYWAGPPKLKYLVYRPIPDPETALLEMETGAVQIATVIPPEHIPRLKKNKDVALMGEPNHTIRGIWFQMKDTPFADVRVRRAVSHGVDLKKIVESLAGDAVVKTQGPLPVISWAHDPTVKELEYDPDLAKKLLADAGWKPGPDRVLTKDGKKFEVTLLGPVGRYVKDKEISEAIQAQLAKLGIKVNVQTMESGAWISKAASKQGYDMCWMGIGPRPPDPAASNLALSLTTTGVLNYWNYSNPEIDNLMKQASGILDQKKRKELYSQVQKLAIQDAPGLLLFTDKSMVAVRKEVKGYRHSGVRLSWLYNDVTIEK